MSTSDTPIPNAPEPFSGAVVAPDEIFEPPADIILRSSDSVDFHCHKNILAHASQFFFDMFGAVCENDDIHKDGKAVIPIKEASGVLYKLLILVYPAHTSAPFVITAPAQLDDICAVHEAANKYQMVRTEALVEDMLVSSSLVDAHPHRFFAIASIRDIKPLLRKAALGTLRDTVDAEVPFIPEFDALTGNHVRALNNFIQRCGKRAQVLASQTLSVHTEMLARADDYPAVASVTRSEVTGELFVWWRDDAGHSATCGGPTVERMGGIPTQEILPPPWYQNHIRQVATALRLLPNGTTAQVATVDTTVPTCPACQQSAVPDLVTFASQLARAVEASNEKVVDEMWN
ncbi:hypothetical protein C8R46DRAFT_936620 [Mycena filopes]|nr:hypothetical protein C8R46DRAFT_936620 [Mycena filopes]